METTHRDNNGRVERQRRIRRRRLAAAGVLAGVVVVVVSAVVAFASGGGGDGDGKAAALSHGKKTASASPKPSPTPTVLRTPTKARPLRLAAYGESVGDCTVFGLWVKCQTEKKVKLHFFTKPSSGLTRPEFFDWPRFLRKDFPKGKYEGVMFMVGANDAQDIQLNGKKLVFGTKAWNRMYAPRVGAVMDLFLERGAQRIYWVGMPRMGMPWFSERMAALNKMYEDEAAKRAPAVEYIDAWTMVDAPSKGYVASFRQSDGVHLSDSGALKSGGFVLKQIKKDWHIR